MARKKFFLLFFIVLVLLIPIIIFLLKVPHTKTSAKPLTPPAIPTSAVVADRLIAKFKPGMAPDEIKDVNKKKDLEESIKKTGAISWEKVFNSDNNSLRLFYVIKFPKGTDLEKARVKLQEIKEIEYVEADKVLKGF